MLANGAVVIVRNAGLAKTGRPVVSGLMARRSRMRVAPGVSRLMHMVIVMMARRVQKSMQAGPQQGNRRKLGQESPANRFSDDGTHHGNHQLTSKVHLQMVCNLD